MASFLRVGLLLVSYLPYVAISGSVPPSSGYCPLHGPIFPQAKQLPTDRDFISARNNISASLNQILDSGISVSLQIFDTKHDDPLFQFASTSKHINKTMGVSKVDEDTVFRLGSVSKLWTILMMLAERGLEPFSERIIKYVPELFLASIDMKVNQTKSDDRTDFVPWHDITVGELASHLAGIARDCTLLPSTIDPVSFKNASPEFN